MPAKACIAASSADGRSAVGGTIASEVNRTLIRAPRSLVVMKSHLSFAEQAIA